MAATQHLVLYSRPDCHLCDVAAELLGQLSVQWCSVNIDDDELLIRRYGIRIPVLENTDTGKVLFWPFDAQKVELLLE